MTTRHFDGGGFNIYSLLILDPIMYSLKLCQVTVQKLLLLTMDFMRIIYPQFVGGLAIFILTFQTCDVLFSYFQSTQGHLVNNKRIPTSFARPLMRRNLNLS